MCINLASTWYPRGELPRFIQLLPVLQEKYGYGQLEVEREIDDFLEHWEANS